MKCALAGPGPLVPGGLLTVPVGATLVSLAIYGPSALAAPSGGWLPALAEVAAVLLLQLLLFQLPEEIGFTGFLQHHWQDRYSPCLLYTSPSPRDRS